MEPQQLPEPVAFLSTDDQGEVLRLPDGRTVRRLRGTDPRTYRSIRGCTGCSWGVLMAYRLHKLARYVRGWMNYFGISDYYRPGPELYQWLRRRPCVFAGGQSSLPKE